MAAQQQPAKSGSNNPNVFPYTNARPRLTRYNFNKQLFLGDHFDAFNIKIDNRDFNKTYAKLRYVVNNFAGLLSKVSADFLFGEPPVIRLPLIDSANPYNAQNDDGINPDANVDADADVFALKAPKPNPNQEWLENLIFENRLDVQFYESAITNSYKGDAIFKLRVGPRRPDGPSEVIIEQVMPDYYFPDLDGSNVSAEPQRIEIAFITEIADKKYLRKEIHTPGQIENQLFLMDGDKIVKPEPLELLGDPELQPIEQTGIDRILVVHVPNWSDGTAHFGLDDYQDITTLIFALNNRLSLIDNILDKHADPILAVPEGVLDENGNIDRSVLGVYEKSQDDSKPEYIVWDAKLDASFSEIEKLLEALYMYSETSPSVFGNTSGQTARTESGRALKYRLMRTVAKIQRKQRYYDYAIKEIVYLAELLAQAHGLLANGVPFKGQPEVPSIEWPDPIPLDSYEQAQEEELRLASGNQSLRDSIKNVDKLDDEQAVQKMQEIFAEQKQLNPAPLSVPTGTVPQTPTKTDPFAKNVQTPVTNRPNPPQ
ncbi:MAG TPA: phage portal protein [Candidatus Saccharimonadales bacterium]|nr:phage portal protein [Candidatus Saccharimonadales bacterium]